MMLILTLTKICLLSQDEYLMRKGGQRRQNHALPVPLTRIWHRVLNIVVRHAPRAIFLAFEGKHIMENFVNLQFPRTCFCAEDCKENFGLR